MRFPSTNVKTLSGQNITVPAGLESQLSLLRLTFHHAQGHDSGSWSPLFERLEATLPEVRTYRMPLMRVYPQKKRLFLEHYMRVGLPDEKDQHATLLLYTDKYAFRHALDIPLEEPVTMLLVDREGEILWRAYGPYNEADAVALMAVLDALTAFPLP